MSLMASSSRVAVSARSSAQRSALRPALSSRTMMRPATIAQPRHVVRAEPEATTTSPDFEKFLKDAQEKWDSLDNKTAVVGYTVGAVVAVWLSSTLIGAVNNVPILPKFLELIGLGYSAWFTYRYLLFKSSREELVKDVTDVKKKITGEADA